LLFLPVRALWACAVQAQSSRGAIRSPSEAIATVLNNRAALSRDRSLESFPSVPIALGSKGVQYNGSSNEGLALHLLLAFQAEGEPVHRVDAQGTHLPLTSYRHSVQELVSCLVDSGFKIYATVLRAPDLGAETTSQGFVIASSPLS